MTVGESPQPEKVSVPARIVREGEALTPEGVSVAKQFNDLFYGELGGLDIDTLEAVHQKLEASGASFDFSSEHAQARIQEELKYMLGWRPRRSADDKTGTWVSAAPSTSDHPVSAAEAQQRTRFGRALMQALSDSVPRPQELGDIQKLVRFAHVHTISFNTQDEELQQAFNTALYGHNYRGDILEFIHLATDLHISLDPRTCAVALENIIRRQFEGVQNVDSDQIGYAETLITFAREHDIPLELSEDDILKNNIIREIVMNFSPRVPDGVQELLDFCKKHNIVLDPKAVGYASKSIEDLLVQKAHDARNSLDIEMLDVVLSFGKKNNIHPDLPAEMLARWREEIPRLLERKKERDRNRTRS